MLSFLTSASFSNQTTLATDQELIKYDGKIEHLFTHCLIAYPSLAFDKNNYMGTSYDRDCLTVTEFKRILKSLYNNDFILVKMSEVYKIENGKAYKKALYLPKDKKPLIFSFDDVNYDTKKLNRGMVDKIILDKNNNIATYTENPPSGEKISYDKEFINVLTNFINTHPDFSHNNAKGLICLTGYDGILGYRTDLIGINRQAEIKQAKKVVKALKEQGWEFASHSYGHYHMTKISDYWFNREVKRFSEEVETLIGKTQIYVYPYGEYEITNEIGQKTNKHKMLEDAGFKLFCGVGKKYFFGYAPFNTEKENRVLFMDRKPIDGFSLRQHHKEYDHLFNSFKVYDHKNRVTLFPDYNSIVALLQP
jgi:peptidoglycan/xylan/chitin deacetylase (PgdA/CDA1 family)